MDIVEGIKQITTVLNDYLKPFGLVAEMDYEFAYYWESDLITFSLLDIPEASNLFLLDAESRFPQIKAPFFIWALHHEIGHNCTYDDLSEEDIAESYAIKNKILKAKKHSDDDKMLYYTCPDEYAATEWAGNYIMTHQERIAKMWNVVSDIIKQLKESYDNEERS